MKTNNLILKTILVLSFVFAGSAFAAASCAADSYRNACKSCAFDNATGKMDSACFKGYQSGGTACVSASYPLAAMQYAKGNCTGIDTCASELTSCKADAASGNDRADCSEGSVSTCFSIADQCVARAAAKCEGSTPSCMPAAAIMFVIGSALLFGFARRQ